MDELVRHRQEPLLQVRNVGKLFEQTEAIRDLTIDVSNGEFLSLLGPSGCGKSTLLMMIAGLVQPTSGSITIGGTPVVGPRADIAVVFQQPVLLPWRTILDNVLFPVEVLRLPRKDFVDRAMELLAMAKIAEFAKHLPHQLSGGMRQRASICRALIRAPSILLMDEPFSALDAITRDEIGVELLRIWQANKKTVIFVTHSIREAAFLSDRVLVMGRRPSTVAAEFKIELPRPRIIPMMEEEPFNHHSRELRKAIEASHAH